ncbi:MAG: Ig-like domain-containing protein [Anaerolineae bacterium]|nr:Ig-like domain-containing protein [Anaerolineae bacterium]
MYEQEPDPSRIRHRSQRRAHSKMVPLAVGLTLLAACGAPTPSPAPTPQVTLNVITTPAPSPSPRMIDEPILLDRKPLRGEELPTDAVLELLFDQPMDQDSVARALRVQTAEGAPVQGTLSWLGDNVASFRPEKGWQPSTRYLVSISGEARSKRGKALARAETFEITTVGALAVAQTIPAPGSAEVSADTAITVLFNRPVVPLTLLDEQASLPQPLVLDPPAEGRGQWLNTSVYFFRPTQPLRAGTTYRARIPAGLRDMTGAVLDADYVWTFSVAVPVAKSITPAPGALNVGLRQPISVTFSQKVDHASAEAAFSIEPPVRGRFVWSEEPDEPFASPTEKQQPALIAPPPALTGAPRGEVMTFIPEEDYQRGQTYIVRVREGVRAAFGEGRTRNGLESSFTAVPLPAVLSTRPKDGETQHNPEEGFSIRFSAPMSVATILPNLAFDPPVTLTGVYSYYNAFDNEFYIAVRFAPSTAYRVRLGGGMIDEYGVPIGKDTEVRFTTSAFAPFVSLQTESLVGVYDANRPTQLAIAHRNVTQLELELATLSLEQFYQLTGAPGAYEALRTFRPTPEQLRRKWTERVEAELNQTFFRRLLLDEAGGALPTGLYLLTITAPELRRLDPQFQPIRHVLVVSNLHVALKVGLRNGVVWVTDLRSGQPIGGLPVSVRGENFAELGTTVTSNQAGEEGQAPFELSSESRSLVYAVVGQPGSAFGLAWSNMSRGIEPYEFGLSASYYANPYLIYLVTDRPVYRPGQRAYFRGIVRRDDDARYQLPDVERVEVSINNPSGQQVLSTTLSLDDNGGFSGEFALDSGAATGSYFLQVCVPRREVKPLGDRCAQYGGISFEVAAYRLPEFEVNIAADKADYLDGETMQFTIESRYFFGGAVANAQVRWALLAENFFFDRYKGTGRYEFNDSDLFFEPTLGRVIPPYRFTEPIADGEGRTDAQGRLIVSLPADLSKRRMSTRFTLEATVTDLNDQSVSARHSVVAHKSRVYFGLATDRFVFEVGEPITVNVIAVNWEGKPLFGQTAELIFSRREWFTVQQEDPAGGLYYSSTPSDTEVSRVTVTTDAEGRASAVLIAQRGGEHRIKVANAATSVYVAEPGTYVGWRVDNNDRIELKPDKTSYAVGEVARVLVPSPFQGSVKALLTIERGNILQRRTVTLFSNSDLLEIPITEDFAPNVFVSVLLVKGVDANNPLPAFRLGYAAFTVEPTRFVLKVSITPDRETYAPRDNASFEIRVTDASGLPVQADLTVALVDKAVLSLVEPNALPILEAFYGERGLGVFTADSLNVSVDRITEKVMTAVPMLAARKGGGGGGIEALTLLVTRRDYRETAYWEARLRTDAEGRARVQVALPDNLTTWVMTARAIAPDTRVGEAQREVQSTKPLLIRPVTPRFFVVGDVITLAAVINNNTPAPIEAQVAIASTNLVLVNGQPVQRVSVPANGAARVAWQMQVQDGTSSLITMTVAGGGYSDSARPVLETAAEGGIPILRYAAPETVATSGDLSDPGQRLEVIALPPRLNTGRGDLTVRVDTSLGNVALRGAKALQAYPYESVDWTASRLNVILALAKARGMPAEAESVSTALQRLYAAQRFDGGWSWWPDTAVGPSDPMVSAHVLLALARASQAGFAVDSTVLARGLDFLTTHLFNEQFLPSTAAANRQAYLLYVLGEAGRADPGRLSVLYEQRAKLSYYAQALLALAFARVQADDPRIQTLLSDLRGAALLSASGAHWQERTFDWENFYGNTRSTSIALYALAQLDPKSALNANVVRWLIAAREGDTWASVQETEWAISAFAEWLARSGERDGTFAWRLALNGRPLLSGQAGTSAETQTAKVALTELIANAANALSIERGAGQGRLYYTAHLRAFVPAESAPAVNRGLFVARKYERADCMPKPEQPCPAITRARIGENVRVRLTLIVPSDAYFVRLVDYLPAGAEAINTTLRTTSRLADPQWLRRVGEDPFGEFGWGWWWFGHSAIYDDRVAVFASYLPAGTYDYTYQFRPSLAGTFQVIPATAELSYFPEVFGRSEGTRFEIEPR